MKVDCISDLHGFYPDLPGGDLLILAGDYTASGKMNEWCDFFKWLKKQNYSKKIVVAGNHDNFMYNGFPKTEQEARDLQEIEEYLNFSSDFEYLCNSGTIYNDINIWGTPWTPWFYRVNPKCKYFMKRETMIAKMFQRIPYNLDILISHGPPHGILDKNDSGIHCGSQSLRKQMFMKDPKIIVCGHIHECGGKEVDLVMTKIINCSYVDKNYRPVNKFMSFDI